MRYMLDTDICIYIIKEQPKHVARRFACTQASEILMSAITYAELMRGVKKSAQVATNLEKLRLLAQEMSILAFDREAAEVYGDVRVDLERRGLIIGANDLLIAAHALQQGLTLVTNNENEFRRVPGLHVENWAA